MTTSSLTTTSSWTKTSGYRRRFPPWPGPPQWMVTTMDCMRTTTKAHLLHHSLLLLHGLHRTQDSDGEEDTRQRQRGRRESPERELARITSTWGFGNWGFFVGKND